MIAGTLILASMADLSGDDEGVVAVYSAISPAYNRPMLPDGSFKPETYAFGNGGNQGGPARDFTIDELSFLGVAKLIAPALAAKQYVPAGDPRQTDLLIMVYWGTTGGFDEAPKFVRFSGIVDNVMERQDWENAKVLGYLTEMQRVARFKGTVFNAAYREDVIDDVEERRYFVVLLAYDFQMVWRTKQRRMLWQTRFSIRAHRNDFGRALPAMAKNASRYFGRDSHGLVRRDRPETRVTFGELKVIEYEPKEGR